MPENKVKDLSLKCIYWAVNATELLYVNQEKAKSFIISFWK